MIIQAVCVACYISFSGMYHWCFTVICSRLNIIWPCHNFLCHHTTDWHMKWSPDSFDYGMANLLWGKCESCWWVVCFVDIPLEIVWLPCSYQEGICSSIYQDGRVSSREWNLFCFLWKWRFLPQHRDIFALVLGCGLPLENLPTGLLSSFNKTAQFWSENVLMLQKCILPRVLMLTEFYASTCFTWFADKHNVLCRMVPNFFIALCF
jgi:hypothetical protein